MTPFDRIVTHPGGAHTDEFLACSVLLTLHPVPVLRREPSADDLTNPAICVVDVGHRHEPSQNNFDHHQFPKDHPPICALSLVLQHLDLYEDARRFCDWLETVERFDTRGPVETAAWLGISPDALTRLNSPVQGALIRQFARSTRIEPGEPLAVLMRSVGEDILNTVRTLRARMTALESAAQFWTLELGGAPAQVLFVPRTDPLPDEPSLGLDRFVHSRGATEHVVAIVSPDRRGPGYALERFRDNGRVDFTRIAKEPGVHFAHARGFVAKTSQTDPAALKALLTQAAVPA